MRRIWGAGLAVTAGLIGAGGCASTARPMLFQRKHAEPCCPSATAMPVAEGPMLGEMPMTAVPAPGMSPGAMVTPGVGLPPGAVVTPGMGLPPGTVTIPGPGSTPAPPMAPPVGPPPRTTPTPPTTPTGRAGKS